MFNSYIFQYSTLFFLCISFSHGLYASYCSTTRRKTIQEENVVIKMLILCTLNKLFFLSLEKQYLLAKQKTKRNRINICYFIYKQWHTGILQLNESLLQFIVHIKCFKGLHLALSEIEQSSLNSFCLYVHGRKVDFSNFSVLFFMSNCILLHM